MNKPGLTDSVVEGLLESGFEVVDCRGQRSSFDILAKRKDLLLLVKVLANIEGLCRLGADELKRVSVILDAVPFVVSERMKNSPLAEEVVYDRYGVYACNFKTLSKIINDMPPSVYSTRGNYFVHVNRNSLVDARTKMGYTQESLARELGVSKQSVYRYESTGRMSLDVFERILDVFEEDLLESEINLFKRIFKEPRIHEAKTTNLKRKVVTDFRELGFKASLTNAPFDVVAKKRERVFSVVSNDWRRLNSKVSMLEEISDLLGGYKVCISERKVKCGTSVLSPKQLNEIRSTKELFKLLTK